MNPITLKQLLEKYYDGETSPEEELVLHLALLDEPDNSTSRRHLSVLEGMMAVAPKARPRHFKLHLGKSFYSVAASFTALLLVAGSFFLFFEKHEPSLLNGEPIAQEEVNRQAEEAFGLLSSCLDASVSQREMFETKIGETDHLLEATWQQLEYIQSDNNYIQTGY